MPLTLKPNLLSQESTDRIHIPGQRKSMVEIPSKFQESSLPTLQKLDVTIKQREEEAKLAKEKASTPKKEEEFDEETLKMAIELKKKAAEQKSTPIQKVEEESEESAPSEEEKEEENEQEEKVVNQKDRKGSEDPTKEIVPRNSTTKDDYAQKIVTSLEIHDMKSFLTS